jgi:hypothetical protein
LHIDDVTASLANYGARDITLPPPTIEELQKILDSAE